MTSEKKEKDPLYQHAMAELEEQGLLSPDSDYDGMLGEAVLELVETFSNQGHSGASAGIVAHLFHELVKFKPLSALTDNPKEWMLVRDAFVGGDGERHVPLWQSRRNPEAFSTDKGKHYYLLSDPTNADGNALLHESERHRRA